MIDILLKLEVPINQYYAEIFETFIEENYPFLVLELENKSNALLTLCSWEIKRCLPKETLNKIMNEFKKHNNQVNPSIFKELKGKRSEAKGPGVFEFRF